MGPWPCQCHLQMFSDHKYISYHHFIWILWSTCYNFSTNKMFCSVSVGKTENLRDWLYFLLIFTQTFYFFENISFNVKCLLGTNVECVWLHVMSSKFDSEKKVTLILKFMKLGIVIEVGTKFSWIILFYSTKNHRRKVQNGWYLKKYDF